jgi:hypothetical protein
MFATYMERTWNRIAIALRVPPRVESKKAAA